MYRCAATFLPVAARNRRGFHSSNTPPSRHTPHSVTSALRPLPHCSAQRQTGQKQQSPHRRPSPHQLATHFTPCTFIQKKGKAHRSRTKHCSLATATQSESKRGDTQPDMLLGYNSAICVQKFNDSRKSAIHTTFRALLRSSSTHEPRDPLFRVVFWLSFFWWEKWGWGGK